MSRQPLLLAEKSGPVGTWPGEGYRLHGFADDGKSHGFVAGHPSEGVEGFEGAGDVEEAEARVEKDAVGIWVEIRHDFWIRRTA